MITDRAPTPPVSTVSSNGPTGQNAPIRLSVIVPTLNEADTLPLLLKDLACQKGVAFEVVVCDGGSKDGTLATAFRVAGQAPYPLRAVTAPPGRGRQMNRGAQLARFEDLLFLHADTRLTREDLLCLAARRMDEARQRLGTHRVAGHFALRFRAHGHRYRFLEKKSLSNRPDTINGDQGMWLARRYFYELGGFDESLPYLEDMRLARRVFRTGIWVLLPGAVETSTRRFESEGFFPRQFLNALIRIAEEIGLERFLKEGPFLYRAQHTAGSLRILPVLDAFVREIRSRPLSERFSLWKRMGRYVAGQGWQIPLALERGENRGGGPITLEVYDRFLGPVLENGPIPWLIASLLALAGEGYGLLSRILERGAWGSRPIFR